MLHLLIFMTAACNVQVLMLYSRQICYASHDDDDGFPQKRLVLQYTISSRVFRIYTWVVSKTAHALTKEYTDHS